MEDLQGASFPPAALKVLLKTLGSMLHGFWLVSPLCTLLILDIYSLLFCSLFAVDDRRCRYFVGSQSHKHICLMASAFYHIHCQAYISVPAFKPLERPILTVMPFILWKAPILSHWELFCCVVWNVRRELLTVRLMVHMSNIRILQGLEFASTLNISTDDEPLRQDQVAVYSDVFV